MSPRVVEGVEGALEEEVGKIVFNRRPTQTHADMPCQRLAGKAMLPAFQAGGFYY
jgi:hypothetical protein